MKKQIEADKLLRNHNLKATPQRLMILNEIDLAGHIDVESLYEHIHIILPSVSLATIYKNINSLTNTGILKEVKIEGLKTQYEIDKFPHIHLICQICNKVQDIEVDEQQLIDRLKTYTDQSINSACVTLYHTCNQCEEQYIT